MRSKDFCSSLGFFGGGAIDGDDALFFEGADCLSTETHGHLLAIDNQGLLLQVWLEHLLGVTLREANAVAELLALTSNITFVHSLISL